MKKIFELARPSDKTRATLTTYAFTIAISAFAASTYPQNAQAQELDGSATLYLWLPAIETDVTSRTTGGEFDTTISQSDVLESLKFGAMAAGDVHYGDFGILADFVYSNLGSGGTTTGPFSSSVDVNVKMLLLKLAAAYKAYAQDGALIEPYAGARYVDLEEKVTVTGGGPLEINANASIDVDGSVRRTSLDEGRVPN